MNKKVFMNFFGESPEDVLGSDWKEILEDWTNNIKEERKRE